MSSFHRAHKSHTLPDESLSYTLKAHRNFSSAVSFSEELVASINSWFGDLLLNWKSIKNHFTLKSMWPSLSVSYFEKILSTNMLALATERTE